MFKMKENNLMIVTLMWLAHFCTGAELTVNEDVCGIGNLTARNRILNDEEPELGEFPWMAYLHMFENRAIVYGCGGSLINRRYVITAGHCISDYAKQHPDKNVVYLGITNTQDFENCGPEFCTDTPFQNFTIDRFFVHKDRDDDLFLRDIALALLQGEVIYTIYVRPICLPLKNTSVQIGIGDMAVIAGWGCTYYSGHASDDLLKATVNVTSLLHHSYGNSASVPDALCAGEYDITDTCDGDSGGPLMKVFNYGHVNRYFLIGITTAGWGNATCPGQYTITSYYTDWILRTVENC